MLQESAMAPVLGTKPNEARSPVHPQRVDGEEIERSVSDPMLNATHPAAVAEAGPADDPLEPWFVFQGFLVTPPNHTSPIASAPSVNFATNTAPALSRRFTTVASSSIIWSSNPPAPQVVLYPFTASKSFAPQGNPWRGPRYLPAAISASACLACARARASVSVTTNFSVWSYFFSRPRHISVSASDETFFIRTSSPNSRTLANAKSSRFFGTPEATAPGALDMRIGLRSVSNFMPGSTGSKISAGSTAFGMCSL